MKETTTIDPPFMYAETHAHTHKPHSFVLSPLLLCCSFPSITHRPPLPSSSNSHRTARARACHLSCHVTYAPVHLRRVNKKAVVVVVCARSAGQRKEASAAASTISSSSMEMHTAPAAAKRMWSYLRAVFFMVRKGVLSNKRKLLVGVHLLMKRRNKAVARTVANLLSHHHHHHYYGGGNALRRREYEFSCSNSPDLTMSSTSSRRRLAYFPSCLGAGAEDDDVGAWPAPLAARIDYAAPEPDYSSPAVLSEEFCVSSPAPPGAFSVRVSNYSSEDEAAAAGSQAVDDEAEEFIRRFYEQLRRQNHVAMLPYLQESAA